MLVVENSIEVSAPPWRVWRTLTKLDGYAQWHPFITASGDPTPGMDVDYVFRNRASQRTLTTAARIILNDESVAFGWRLGVGKLLAFDETFEIQPSEGGVLVRHRMKGRGVMAHLPVPVLKRGLLRFIVATDDALDRHLRGAVKTPPAPGNRIKRRTDSARARHHSSMPGGSR